MINIILFIILIILYIGFVPISNIIIGIVDEHNSKKHMLFLTCYFCIVAIICLILGYRKFLIL